MIALNSQDGDFRRKRRLGGDAYGDGADPKYDSLSERAENRRGKPDHAALRLGARIREAIIIGRALEAIPGSERFTLEEVAYSGRGDTYIVVFSCADAVSEREAGDFLESLRRSKGALRRDIAGSINRKKTPEVSFHVLPPGARL